MPTRRAARISHPQDTPFIIGVPLNFEAFELPLKRLYAVNKRFAYGVALITIQTNPNLVFLFDEGQLKLLGILPVEQSRGNIILFEPVQGVPAFEAYVLKT